MPRPEPPELPSTKPVEPAPGSQPAEDRCERCGGVIATGTGIGGLCDRCRGIEQESAIRPGEREWRVQKTDGVILGPLTLDEVRVKFHQGEVAATDRVARGEADFRLISSYAEFAGFFRRPGEVFEMTFRHTPLSHRGRNIAILVVLVLLLAGAGGWYQWSRKADSGGAGDEYVRRDVLEMFAKEIPIPTGTAGDAVASGRKFMLLDDRLSYLQADKAFKTAMLLDPDNAEACAGWVQNRALLDRRRGDVASRKTALDLIDYFLRRETEDPRLHRAKAFLLFSLGRNEEARVHAQKAKDQLEDDAESLLILGATYIESSTDMAVGMIKQALEADAGLNVAYRFLGEAAVRQGKFHRALGYFQNRLEKDPGEFETLAAAAKVYSEVGQFGKAVDTYEIILAASPHRAEALVALARLYTQILKNPRKALAVLDGALKPGDKLPAGVRAQVLTEHSIAHRLLGNSKKAAASAQSAVEDDPMYTPALYARAVREHGAGRVDPGLRQLRELQVHLAQSSRLRARIAEMESLVPNFPKAQEEFKRAVEMDPADLDIHLMMAVFHAFLDSPTQAYAWLRKSMAIDPFFEQAHSRVTAFYDGPAFLKITVQRAMQAARKYDEDALIQALCGIVLLRAGHADHAKNRLQKALALDSECFHANMYLGVLALSRRKPAAAIQYLERAHETDSLHAMVTKLLGRAYMRKGKLKRAAQIFKTVLDTAPGDLGARLGLGEVYLKIGKKGQAARLLLKVYQGDEDNLWVKRLLFQLGH
jgi:tetratricopeptide (TPR) repeat protein